MPVRSKCPSEAGVEETDPGPVGEPEMNELSHEWLRNDAGPRARGTVAERAAHAGLSPGRPQKTPGGQKPLEGGWPERRLGGGCSLRWEGALLCSLGVSEASRQYQGWVCLLLHSADVY